MLIFFELTSRLLLLSFELTSRLMSEIQDQVNEQLRNLWSSQKQRRLTIKSLWV